MRSAERWTLPDERTRPHFWTGCSAIRSLCCHKWHLFDFLVNCSAFSNSTSNYSSLLSFFTFSFLPPSSLLPTTLPSFLPFSILSLSLSSSFLLFFFLPLSSLYSPIFHSLPFPPIIFFISLFLPFSSLINSLITFPFHFLFPPFSYFLPLFSLPFYSLAFYSFSPVSSSLLLFLSPSFSYHAFYYFNYHFPLTFS